MNPTNNIRNQQITTDYQSGMTMQQVGDKHNITRERVRQILSKQGIGRISRKKGKRLHNKVCKCGKAFCTTYKNGVYCNKECFSKAQFDKNRTLTDEQVRNIRSLYYVNELTGIEIGKIHSITPAAIYHILSGRSYKSVI